MRQQKDKALEIFCGSGNLTVQLRLSGVDALGVDWKGNRHKPDRKCLVELDLTRDEDVKKLWEIVVNKNVKYVHFGPPCGTFSRAREKPISAKLKAQGVREPQPS